MGLGAEHFVGSRGAQRPGDLCQEQEVVEEEAIELLVALGLIELPAVQELARAQTVGHRVEYQLLKQRGSKNMMNLKYRSQIRPSIVIPLSELTFTRYRSDMI